MTVSTSSKDVGWGLAPGIGTVQRCPPALSSVAALVSRGSCMARFTQQQLDQAPKLRLVANSLRKLRPSAVSRHPHGRDGSPSLVPASGPPIVPEDFASVPEESELGLGAPRPFATTNCWGDPLASSVV
jgi:hypothetical protein